MTNKAIPPRLAMLPDSDITASESPYHKRSLEIPDSAHGQAMSTWTTSTEFGTDEIFAIDGSVARRTVAISTKSLPRLDSIAHDKLELLTRLFGEPSRTRIDTLIPPESSEPIRRKRWWWHASGASVLLESAEGAFLRFDDSHIKQRVDSLIGQNPTDSFLPRLRGLSDVLFADSSLPAGTVKIRLWNRISPETLMSAMSTCLQTRHCAVPGDMGAIDARSDSLELSGDGVDPAWLPIPTDTFHRTIDSGFAELPFPVDEIVGYGLVDSASDYNVIFRSIPAFSPDRLVDTLRSSARQGLDTSFKTSVAGIFEDFPTEKQKWIPVVLDMILEEFGQVIESGIGGGMLALFRERALLVRKRPAKHEWPLEKWDITQAFKPFPRRRTRNRNLPENHPIGFASNFEDHGRHNVLFIDGKVQRRALTYSFYLTALSRKQLDSAYLDNLDLLRKRFGYEEETMLDTSTLPNGEKKLSTWEDKIWHRGNGEIRLLRIDKFDDTGETRATVERVLRRMVAIDSSLDSARIAGLRAEKIHWDSTYRSEIQMFQISLSNPLPSERLVRAMAACLDSKDCAPSNESGFFQSGDSIYTTTFTLPKAWLPEAGVRSATTKPDTDTGDLAELLQSQEIRGTFDPKHRYTRIDVSLKPRARERLPAMVEKLWLEAKKEMEEEFANASVYEKLEYEESIPLMVNLMLATWKQATRFQSLFVERSTPSPVAAPKSDKQPARN
ncbi:MAG: hypothetical protein AAB214_17910 [Fibrobacterota bacterium]